MKVEETVSLLEGWRFEPLSCIYTECLWGRHCTPSLVCRGVYKSEWIKHGENTDGKW